jgi:hypothetical protein
VPGGEAAAWAGTLEFTRLRIRSGRRAHPRDSGRGAAIREPPNIETGTLPGS